MEAREAEFRRPEADLPTSQHSAMITSNPLQSRNETPEARATQTVPSRTVFHEATAAIRPLTSMVHTQEQLDELIAGLRQIQ